MRRHSNHKPERSNTSQLIGLVNFKVTDSIYSVVWKKLTLNQVLRFKVLQYICDKPVQNQRLIRDICCPKSRLLSCCCTLDKYHNIHINQESRQIIMEIRFNQKILRFHFCHYKGYQAIAVNAKYLNFVKMCTVWVQNVSIIQNIFSWKTLVIYCTINRPF